MGKTVRTYLAILKLQFLKFCLFIEQIKIYNKLKLLDIERNIDKLNFEF